MFISDLIKDKSHKATRKELVKMKKWAMKELDEWSKFIDLLDKEIEKK